jgi:predicted permease
MFNLRFALRTLFKTPFVTGIAILSLALGLGANSAIYSMFDQLLLRSLSVPQPERLVNLGAPGPKQGSNSCNQTGGCDEVFSYPMFKDLQQQQTSFTGIAAHRIFDASLAYKGQTETAECVLVSGSYFPVLGLQPALGRLLLDTDDQVVGESHVVVLSHDYWTTRFGADPSVLNEKMLVNGQPMTVVGVAQKGFAGATAGSRPRLFVPITMRGVMEFPFAGAEAHAKAALNRKDYWAYLFARRKPGVTLDQAAAAINVPYRALINDVEAAQQTGMSDQTLQRFRAKLVTLQPGARGQSEMHREAKTPLLLLFSVTAVVLLIACANIANLLLARSAARAGEMAIRLSVGASRGHILGQLLLEACLLALMGGAAGLLVARWTLALIASLLPADATSSLSFDLQPSVLLFTAGLSLVTGLLFGLFPALHSTRPDLASTLKGQAGQPAGSRAQARFRSGLVTLQIALSMALLVCAGLFLKSLVQVSRVDLGLKIDDVVTFRISPRRNGYPAERSRALFPKVEEELKALPGATAVTASMVPLLAGSNWGNSVTVEGFDAGPDTDTEARFNAIGPGYFRAMGVPLMSGREFAETDALGAPKVAIVNEAFTRKFNLGRAAVGKRMRRGLGKGQPLDIEIVGVVQNAKYSRVKDAVPALFFLPYRQDDRVGDLSFYVRSATGPEQLLKTIPPLMARLDASLPVDELRTMPQQVRENVFLDRLLSTMAAAFASLATLLAAVGLYGVLAYTVAQRTREFGLRMALGADAGRVRRMVMVKVGWLTLIGGAIGTALALGVGSAAKALLFEVKGHDPLVLAGSAVLLALVAGVAGLVPALRASRIDPMRALRYE